jgi:subtilisin family serine protease
MRIVLTTLLLAFLLISTATAQPGPPDKARPIEGVILVKFAPDALDTPPQELRPNELGLQGRQAARLRQLLNARGPGQKLFRDFMPADTLGRHRQTGEPVRLKDLSRWYRFPVRDTTNVDSLAARLQELPVVLKATPDYNASLDRRPSTSGLAPPRTVPNDPRFPNQWGYDDSDDHDVDAPEAWSLQTGRSDVTVAVVDDGVDLDHPDLDPGDRSRVIQGYDFGEDDSDPGDDADHGTPVAGTIGARTNNNQTGVAGLMWDLQIMPLKIATSSGDLPFSAAAQAFDYARSNGADVINYSISSPLPSPDGAVSEAVYNAYASGMVFVSASGNDSKNSVDYPAALHTSVGVGATDFNDSRWGYSNYGPSLDLVGPAGFQTTERYGTYGGFGGTSQATPVVSGIAGLILSESRDENLNLSNNDVVHLLERTAEDVNASQYPGRDNRIGHGRVNARKALEALQPPNEVSHGTASFTKIRDDTEVDFVNGFTTENGTVYGAGRYICDIYELSASASSPDFYYKETPWFWLPVTEKGFSGANPNDGDRYLSKSVSKSSAEATTFFYYVESNVGGQEIGWVPYDPTVHKRNGSFEYTVIGEPGTPPLETTLSGPSTLESGQTGTWTASVSGGTGSTSYDWEYRPLGSFSWQGKYCTGESCSHTFYNNADQVQTGGIRAVVTKGSETDTASTIVSVPPSCGDNVLICPATATAGAQAVAVRSLSAQPAGETAATLTWTTTGTLPASEFVVHHRPDSTGTWTPLGTVAAADSMRTDTTDGPAYRFEATDLAVGTHQFRLAYEQSPEAGDAPARALGGGQQAGPRAWTSEPVEAQIEMEEAYRLSAYPNPVRQQATVELAVKKRQDVTVSVYDVLGRRVATLHGGPLPAQETRRLRFNARDAGLSSGSYFVRIAGEDFAATKRLTVVR